MHSFIKIVEEKDITPEVHRLTVIFPFSIKLPLIHWNERKSNCMVNFHTYSFIILHSYEYMCDYTRMSIHVITLV